MSYADRITTGKIAKPMRNCLYGVEGIGKSTFAAMFPQPITLSAEDGTNHLDTTRIVTSDWYDTLNFLAWLYNEEHEFKTLNIDTVGWVEEQAAKALCARHRVDSLEQIDKGFGKYKRYMFEEFQLMLNWCSALHGQGMHINFIGHTTVKTFKNPEDVDYDRYNMSMIIVDLAAHVRQWCDNVLFFNYDTMIDKAEKGAMGAKDKAKSFNRRLVHTQRAAAYDAKNRMGLPDTFEFTTPPDESFKTFWQYYENWCNDAAPVVTPTTN